MHKLLVVEDDIGVYEPLCELLRFNKFDVDLATTEKGAIKKIEEQGSEYDLALLDINLPDGTGITVSHYAKEYHIDYIFLTATDNEYTTAKMLNDGAADYIPKPFSDIILIAKISNILRRAGKIKAEETWGELHFDLVNGSVSKCGKYVSLSQAEYELLLCLLRNKGKFVSYDMLIDDIFARSGNIITQTGLSVRIKRLRDKIEADPSNPVYIETVRGRGYMLSKPE